MSNIIDKSFQIIRTNPKLTSNLKINIDTNLKIYLESFNANKQLSDDQYKHYSISEQSYLEDKIPLFYDGLPINLAYEVKDDNDKDIVYKDFSHQFDDIYWSGVKKTEQNSFYDEEFEYFAPLYLKYKDLPDNFIILRVDNPGIYELSASDYKLSNTNSDNFKTEIIDKWKTVKVFDLTTQSTLGSWLDNNFISNTRYPDTPFEFDSNSGNFSRWYGIDYYSGIYTEKSLFIKDKIWYENPHFKLEEFITNGFKINELIYPNILNLNYLFDDDPATPYQKNKYSINRYYGFYVDMEKIETLTSYKQQDLILDLKLEKNVFMNIDQVSGSTCPFLIWDDDIKYYLYIIDNLFEVVKIIENNETYYKLVCEYDVDIEDITNEKEIDILFQNTGLTYKNLISSRNISTLILDRIIKSDSVDELYADLYLIKMDNKYHVLEFVNNEYLIRTDYGIRCDDEILKYWIELESSSTEIIVHDQVNNKTPIVFEIFRVKFRDIKDFDYNRVDTGFADFDFDREDEYVETSEQKLYTVEHRDATESTVFKKYDTTSPYADKIIIASSEYVADDELYEITKQGLSNIWDKNPNIVKWGYSGSISHSDYIYKLNNSNKVGFTYNRTTNPFSTIPDVFTKTNDFYYRIGTFISGTTSGSTFDYKYFKTQSLSIETDSYTTTGETIQFNLDEYLDCNVDYFDYFDYFFNNKRYVNSDLEYVQTQNFSLFNNGSEYNPASTLFKGIKYNIYKVDDVIKDVKGNITQYLTDKNYDFNQYKFCVVANYYTDSSVLSALTAITYATELSALTAITQRDYPSSGVISSINLGVNNLHVFFNEKYKNILIIINVNSIVKPMTLNMNNLTYYDKEVIYNGIGNTYNTLVLNNELTIANNFINKINNNYITYYYIDENCQTGYTENRIQIVENGNMENIIGWDKYFAPIKIECETPLQVNIKKNSYTSAAIKGPKYNIYDKYKIDYTESIYDQSFIKEPLARYLKLNEKELEPRAQEHGEKLIYDKTIYRFNGSYEPVFKNIEIFNNLNYYIVNGSEFSQSKIAINYSEEYDNEIWSFKDYSLACDNRYTECNLVMSTIITGLTSNILVLSNFGFDISEDTEILGINVLIKKKSAIGPNTGSTSFKSGISDLDIKLTTNLLESDNKAILNTYDNGLGSYFTSSATNYYQTNFWTTNQMISEYGGNTDLWGLTNLSATTINSTGFSLKIQCESYRDLGVSSILNIAYIDCATVQIFYTIDSVITGETYVSVVERNVKFDTGLKNFGLADNIICSKINEIENMLKLKNTDEDKSIYPMIDEYGYDFGQRNIFKSTWDTDYYTRTKNELE